MLAKLVCKSSMGQHYSNPTREADPYALPDVETFYLECGEQVDEEGTPLEAGWYYWYCFPGCLPDGEPCGPYKTKQDALHDVAK